MAEIIGIGLANMDLVAHVKDEFLKAHKIRKGHANKFDDLSFARMRAELDQYDAIPGGCAANTLCGMAASGVPARFFGKIGEDSFESLYRASFGEYTVTYDVEAGSQESSQCAVLVTPDGERSFAYSHGAGWDLAPQDFDAKPFDNAALVYAEIYMFEFGKNNDTAKFIIESLQQSKTPFLMNITDQDFGRRYSQKVRALADAEILSLIVGNHENMPSLTGTTTVEDTLQKLTEWKCDTLMTASENGAYYITGGKINHYPVTPVAKPKNTTGAGDQFLAGFLTGRLDDKPVAECMEYAASCAKMILMHDTARPPLVNKHSIRF